MMGRTQDWDRFTRTVPSWENYATARQRWMDTGSSVYLDQMIEAMPPEGDVPDIAEKPRQTWLTMQGPPEPALLPENKEREIRELCRQELGWWKWWLLRHHWVHPCHADPSRMLSAYCDYGTALYDYKVSIPGRYGHTTVSQCCWRCLYHSLTDFYDDGPLVITSRDHEHPPTPEIRKGGVVPVPQPYRLLR